MIINAMIDISLISLGLAIISQLIQGKFLDREKMKTQQKEMKEKQKIMQELMKKEDLKSKNELESMQKELMQQMQGMMSGSMKMMVASMVIFLPAFAILGFFYSEAIIQLPIPLPWFGTESLIEIFTETNWFGWYFVSYLSITILMNIGKKLIKNFGVING